MNKPATKRTKPYWIKERHNPQFDKPYYVAVGQLSRTAAKKYASSLLYGTAVMHEFSTKKEFDARLSELRSKGFTVYG